MDSDLLSNVQKRKGTVGGAQGFMYEIKLILLFMIRACLNKVSFKLVSNADGFGNFDDLVADCELLDKTKTVFCVQAKNFTSQNKITINKHALIGERSDKKSKIKPKEPFKLSKYRNNIKNGSLISSDRDFQLLFVTTAKIEDSDPDVQWCDVSPQDIVCKLFNTSDGKNCAKRFSETGNEKLLTSLENDRDFLNKVCFMSSQCSVSDLDTKLREDLGKLIGKQDQHVLEKLSALLYRKISEWYLEENFENKVREQNLTERTESKVHERFDKSTDQAYYTHTKFVNLLFEFALKELPCLSFENELEHLARNYSNSKSAMCTKINNNSLLVINTGDSSTLLALLEVYNEIKLSSNETVNNLGNHMFVKSQDLGETLNLFDFCLDMIIIDCSNIGSECVVNIKKIEEIVETNTKKRAVFLIHNKSKHVVPQTSKYIYYNFQFNSLTKETQNFILDFKLMFQGNEVPLRDLIKKEDASNVVRSEIVEKLLKQDSVVIGKQLQGLKKETEYCYIERTFHCTPVVSSNIFETLAEPGSSDILLVSVQQLSDLSKHQNKFVNFENVKQNTNCSLFYNLTQSHLKIRKLLANRSEIFPNKNVHWLEVRQSCFVWLETKGSVDNIDKYVTICSLENNKRTTNGVGEDIVVGSENNTNIIIDTAGMGKTTVLNKIARKLKKKHHTCWVVHCDLNSIHIISKLKKINNKNRNLDVEEIQELCFEEKLDNNENLIFKYLLSVRKVVFFFDGFDEICPKYENECMHFLQKLRKSYIKFWLTSRENMESFIKKHLNAFPMKLLPTSQQKQIEMCTKYFQYELDTEYVIKKEKIGHFSAALILSVNCLSRSIVQFMGIPLITNMLATINLEKCREALNLHYKADQSATAFKNIYDMYMEFFYRKIHRNLTEKQSRNENAEHFDRDLKDKFSKNMKSHILIAAFSLLPEEYLNLLTEQEKKEVQNYFSSSEEVVDLVKIGIITNLTVDGAKFIHFTFAEFLLAKFISEKLSLLSRIQDILDYFLYADNLAITRKFLNYSILKNLKNITGKYNPLLNINKEKKDIFDIAVREDNCQIAEFIIKCLQGNRKQINKLLLRKHEVDKFFNVFNDYNKDIVTVLHIAVKYGSMEMVLMLLDQGVDCSILTDTLDTPLHVAAYYGHCDVVNVLLDHGADVNQRNGRNETAVILAAHKGNCDVVTVLLDHGANLDDKDWLGHTVLMHSAMNRQNDFMTLLLATGKYNIYDTDKRGRTALHLAASCGHCLNIKTLLDHEAEKMSQGNEVRTPLLNCQDDEGYTPLHKAVIRSRLQCVQYLIQRGADRSITDNKGSTGLDVCTIDIRPWMIDNQNSSDIEVRGELCNNRY